MRTGIGAYTKAFPPLLVIIHFGTNRNRGTCFDNKIRSRCRVYEHVINFIHARARTWAIFETRSAPRQFRLEQIAAERWIIAATVWTRGKRITETSATGVAERRCRRRDFPLINSRYFLIRFSVLGRAYNRKFARQPTVVYLAEAPITSFYDRVTPR